MFHAERESDRKAHNDWNIKHLKTEWQVSNWKTLVYNLTNHCNYYKEPKNILQQILILN